MLVRSRTLCWRARVTATTFSLPVAANPAFAHRPYVAGVFFLFARFTLLWLILPLVLARLYDFYKDIHVRRLSTPFRGW